MPAGGSTQGASYGQGRDRRNDKNLRAGGGFAKFGRGIGDRRGRSMRAYDWFMLATLAAVALAIGSFVANLAVRLPAGESMDGRSRCPHCGHRLGVGDLVPLASWAALRGRCRYCHDAISVYYPLVELAALGLALWAWTAMSGWLVPASSFLGWTLLALALIDWRHFILPDVLTLPLVPAGLAVAWFAAPDSLIDNAIGAVVGYGLFTLVAWAYHRWRGRHGLGAGDAKLLGALGAWVGAGGLPSLVLVASLLALVAALTAGWLGGRPLSRLDRVPFGPFLAAAGWVVWLYGPLLG